MQFVTATRLLYHVHIRRISDAVRVTVGLLCLPFHVVSLTDDVLALPCFHTRLHVFVCFFHVSLDALLKIEKTHFLATWKKKVRCNLEVQTRLESIICP